MRLLHYLEIQNFKRFGDRQRIELDHPAVLIGPNNCGKTTAIQAIALWSQAVKTWFDSKGLTPPKQRTATALNRLNIVAVPVQRTRYFWHNATVRNAHNPIVLEITLGVLHEERVVPVTMRFRNQGDDLVYCTPDEDTLARPEVIQTAAGIHVELLYPISGLETEEPILQPGRINVLLGQGQTAQVLRNLCLIVHKDNPKNWQDIVNLAARLFAVRLGSPTETARGSIDLFYQQSGVKNSLDIALAGRGFQQMLLILAYLYSHRRSVLLIDEPDAHLEILRQKQVYVLLRDIAHQNDSQVVLVTHSEAVLEEALDRNLTLLLGERSDNLARDATIRNALKHYGAEHYIRARQCGYVLYVEGRTDLDILRAFADRLAHPVADIWDERINACYVQANRPHSAMASDLERAEEDFGRKPRDHFFALRSCLPRLKGLAIRDSNGREQRDSAEGDLAIVYWHRYEAENYFVTPTVLTDYATATYQDKPLFLESIKTILDTLIQERVFTQDQDFAIWQSTDTAYADLLWARSTENSKLSDFAEEFFRRLAEETAQPMLLRKGELHRLINSVEPQAIDPEVAEKLTLLQELFTSAQPEEETL